MGFPLFLVEGNGLEPIGMQVSGGHLLPPVQKLVATIIFARPTQGQKCKRVPFGVPIKNAVNDTFTAFFIYAERKGLERLNRNMPVAYCCHQFKNWWLP